MGPRRHFKRNRKDQNPYPTAPQIRDAYSQLPTQFGKPPTTRFPSSASGSNSTPLSTPEEVEMKRQIENAWRVREGRERGGKFVDIGGFRVPAPPRPDVQGRSGEDNKVLAEGFKMLMEGDDKYQDPYIGSMDPDSSPREPSRYQYERQALSKAFQQEYCLPHHHDITKSRTPARHFRPQDESEDEDDELPVPYRIKRSRNDIIAGQEIGVGVIGSNHPDILTLSDTAAGKEYRAKVIEGEHGCDTPMYQFLDSKRGVPILPSLLDLDLPPLAIEHPARMWNSLIHSLKPELQPIVKWRYERSEEQTGWIAHLTLVLPPTHPAISQHALSMTVPKNTRSKEYINVVDLLGGVKRWSGSPKKFKAEAQNTALVKCILDDAISWIYAPVTASVPADEDDIVEEIPSGEGAGSDEIVIDEDMLDDQEQVQEAMVPKLPKAISTSDESEIIQEDVSLDSPGKQSSEAGTEVPTEVDDGPLEVLSPIAPPEATRHNAPSPKLSNRSLHSSPSRGDEPFPFNRDDNLVTEIDSEPEDSDPEGDLCQDPGDPTQWYDKLMATIESARHDEYFDYDFVTHRVGRYPKGKKDWYMCHFVMYWPREDKALAWTSENWRSSEIVAKEAVCAVVIRSPFSPKWMVPYNERSFREAKMHEGPVCGLISLCRRKDWPAPQFGTRTHAGSIYGHISIDGHDLTDSIIAVNARVSRSPWEFWNAVANMILRFADSGE